ncbi:hypothetical protein [Streptomyces sp. NPDC021096]|uniref:hypothetical protein n=1 Tax=Streptomyces sp. NPDC021096 TaxID=3154792 RepID=UPI0033C5F13A
MFRQDGEEDFAMLRGPAAELAATVRAAVEGCPGQATRREGGLAGELERESNET